MSAHLRGVGHPGKRIVELDWGSSYTIDDSPDLHTGPALLRALPVPEQHPVVVLGVHRPAAPGVLRRGHRLHRHIRRHRGHGPFDLTLLPIGAYNKSWPDIHMNPEEAVRAHRDLNGDAPAGSLVPIHWCTFRLAPHPWSEPADRLIEAAVEAACGHRRARPGGRVAPGQARAASVQTWWRFDRSPPRVGAAPRRPRDRRSQRAGDSAGPTLSDEPPPLAAAIPLPDNAVDNAIAKLDGLISDPHEVLRYPRHGCRRRPRWKTLYAKGFGVREAGKPERVDADTVFQLASLSKPIAATVVATRSAPGRQRLGHPDPGAPAGSRCRPRREQDAHRRRSVRASVGLSDHAGDLLEDLGYSRREVLARLRYLPLDPFRTSYAYTNFGVAAAEAAAAAGRPWRTSATR